MRNAIQKMRDWLLREDNFLLISHVSPDGDTIGSALALALWLRALGKRAVVVCEHIIPVTYAFLPGTNTVITPEEAAQQAPFRNAIAIDCAVPERMGSAGMLFEAAEATANIDHHATNTSYGDYVIIDPSASATGELVFLLLKELLQMVPEEVRKQIAVCLFTAISTDTGNFAYSNTIPQTFRICAELLEFGIDIAEINRNVYRTVPIGKTRLLGYVLSSMQLLEEGRIGVTVITLQDVARAGATVEDVEGVVDGVRDVDTVEIAILMRERNIGGYKISLRSKRYVDVSAIAARFGGGGHKHAAGCDCMEPFQRLYDAIIAAAKMAL